MPRRIVDTDAAASRGTRAVAVARPHQLRDPRAGEAGRPPVPGLAGAGPGATGPRGELETRVAAFVCMGREPCQVWVRMELWVCTVS